MVLTKEQGDKFLKMLNSATKNYSCPICGNIDFDALDTIFGIPERPEGALFAKSGINMYPVITVVCKKCGYTLLFNTKPYESNESNKETNEE